MNKTKMIKLVLVGTSMSTISHAAIAQQSQQEQKSDSTSHSTRHSYSSRHVNRWNYLLHSCDDGYHPFRVFHTQHYLNGQPTASQPHYHQKSLAAIQPANQSSNTNASNRATRGGFGSSASHSSSAAS